MRKILAFIDESGDPHFNEDASSLLEFACIIIEPEHQEEVNSVLQRTMSELNLKELKSASITEGKRIKILQFIENLRFKFIDLSIDKSKVFGDWKNHSKVFYKHSQKILNRELNRLYEGYTLTIDKYCSPKYQESLKNYLEKHGQLDLFDNTVYIGSAKSDLIIQLADVIAGTKRKLRLNEFSNPDTINALLDKHELYSFNWPQNYTHLVLETLSDQQDHEVAKTCLDCAQHYINQFKAFESHKPKVLTIEYLLFHTQFVDAKSFIYTAELINWLRENGFAFSEEEFRSEIIGQLRDEKVIIAGSRKGLKIPITMGELISHLNFSSSKYLTMMKRCKNAFDAVNAISMGNIDLLNAEAFKIHKELFRVIEK